MNASNPIEFFARGTGSDSDACNNRRNLFNIVWGCFTTLFACVWVAAHPNVPPPTPPAPTGKGVNFWRRLRWRVVDRTEGLRRRVKLMLATLIAPELIVGFAGRQLEMAWHWSTVYDISLTHGFFICMGGFVDDAGHPIVRTRDLDQHMDAIRQVSEVDILNRSQGDAFSKTVALLQTLWFVVQCLARLNQRLPLTELEVATLAFAAVNAFTWILWWNKPLDVRAPIKVGPSTASDPLSGPAPRQIRTLVDKFLYMIGFSNFTQALHQFDPFREPAVPTFYFASHPDDKEKYTPFISIIVTSLFGAIHCAAWRAHFLSAPEKWLWRASSVVVSAVPVTLLTVYGYDLAAEVLAAEVIVPLWLLGSLFYVPARIVLFGLPLAALREVSLAAYMEVNWNKYLPHV